MGRLANPVKKETNSIKSDKLDKFDLEVISALRELEIPPHVKGYELIKIAMRCLHRDRDLIYSMTKGLYPAVGEIFGDDEPSHIERGIRHALNLSRADKAAQRRVLGRTGHISNSEFLATLYEVISVKMAGVA